jgi:hypothetical protein
LSEKDRAAVESKFESARAFVMRVVGEADAVHEQSAERAKKALLSRLHALHSQLKTAMAANEEKFAALLDARVTAISATVANHNAMQNEAHRLLQSTVKETFANMTDTIQVYSTALHIHSPSLLSSSSLSVLTLSLARSRPVCAVRTQSAHKALKKRMANVTSMSGEALQSLSATVDKLSAEFKTSAANSKYLEDVLRSECKTRIEADDALAHKQRAMAALLEKKIMDVDLSIAKVQQMVNVRRRTRTRAVLCGALVPRPPARLH